MKRAWHRFIPATAALLLASTLGAARLAAEINDTLTTPSGLRYVITQRGTGATPAAGQFVLVHYTGRLTDGTIFDDSRERGEPFAFKLGMGQVIKGWDEGIAKLHVGDRAVLIIPSELGYGASGAGSVIPPNATLLFDVELVDIKEKTLGGMLAQVIESKGVAAAKREYARWKKGSRDAYYVSEAELNGLGYQYLNKKKDAKTAMEIFKINADLFPKSANVYDSLGEACMTAGDRRLAVVNYERSLELDPTNKNAEDMLKKLKEK